MAVTRQDAWSEDDDLLLAEVTLRHIREGSTQLAAFEEVGYRLNRTAAACGFRWNSLIRKKYQSAIQIAKAQRQQFKARNKNRLVFQPEAETSMLTPTATGYTPNYMQELAMEESFTNVKEEGQKTEQISLDDVIRFLRSHKDNFKNTKHLDRLLQEKENEIQRLKEENIRIRKELDSVQREHQMMNEDYQVLMKIMERARKLAFLAEEEHEPKLSFKMDRNGNLERVEK